MLAGARDDYTFVLIDADTVEISGPEGIDYVTGVESFAFADLTQSFAGVIVPREPNVSAGNLAMDTVTVLEDGAIEVTWNVTSNGTVGAATSSTEIVVATSPDMASVVANLGTQETGGLAIGSTDGYGTTLYTTGLAPGTY